MSNSAVTSSSASTSRIEDSRNDSPPVRSTSTSPTWPSPPDDPGAHDRQHRAHPDPGRQLHPAGTRYRVGQQALGTFKASNSALAT